MRARQARVLAPAQSPTNRPAPPPAAAILLCASPARPPSSSPLSLSLSQIKPDGVARGLVGEIIARFEKKGLKLTALKMASPSRAQLEAHYADLSSKGFFAGLITYMLSGPVVCMVWEGKNAFAVGRQLLGATKPADSAPGTIRFDYAIDVGRNLCHGSDSKESAAAEIALWFPEGVNKWSTCCASWVYE